MDAIFWNESAENWYPYPIMNRYIGSYKVAHWIRKHGHTAQVLDFIRYMDEETLYQLTVKFIDSDTKILGISTTFMSSGKKYLWKNGEAKKIPEHIFTVLTRIKAEFPKIKIVIGGYMSDKIYFFGLADATITSYTQASEDIFLEYLEHLKYGTPKPFSTIIVKYFEEHKFTSTERLNIKSRIHYHAARNPKFSIEVDDFKFTKQDAILHDEVLPLDVSRGCIFACKFCQYPHLGKKKLDYIRGMEYIQQELEYNYSMFGTTKYNILDDTFNDTEYKLKSFSDMTGRLPFKIDYTAYIRVDLVHRYPDMAYMLKDSGLAAAFHGLESLHPEASHIVGKAWSGKHAKQFVPELYHNIWGGTIAQSLGFISGLPHEDRQSLRNTVRWFLDNDLYNMSIGSLGLYGTDNVGSEKSIYSEFDRNYKEYGYTFTTDETQMDPYWVNDIWNQRESQREAKLLMRYVNGRANKVDAWVFLPTIHMGASRSDLMTTPGWKQDFDFLSMNFHIKINEYFNKLREL